MLMLVVGGIYIATIAILAFYSVTFAVAVMGGLQFIADFFVLSSVSVQAMKIVRIELKGCKHLFGGHWCENSVNC